MDVLRVCGTKRTHEFDSVGDADNLSEMPHGVGFVVGFGHESAEVGDLDAELGEKHVVVVF